MKCVPKVLINNIPALVQIMAWRRPSEAMMVNLPTHICITQWVIDSVCIWQVDCISGIIEHITLIEATLHGHPRVSSFSISFSSSYLSRPSLGDTNTFQPHVLNECKRFITNKLTMLGMAWNKNQNFPTIQFQNRILSYSAFNFVALCIILPLWLRPCGVGQFKHTLTCLDSNHWSLQTQFV